MFSEYENVLNNTYVNLSSLKISMSIVKLFKSWKSCKFHKITKEVKMDLRLHKENQD